MSVCSSPDLPDWTLRSDNTLLNCSTTLLHNRYRILKPLGQGGFGQTWLAVDEWQSPLRCVIKQLLPHYSIHAQKTLTLFQQEAQRLAELGEHSQIPKLLNTFEQGGEMFIVQEWVNGWTLEQEVAGAAPLNETEVRQVLQQLLPVIQYLHNRQIIHRDIKPANIIRRKSDNQLVLVDFGAAKQLFSLNPVHTGTMIGSAEYAAPEQIRGQAVFASDLYSLGVTCLYLLTQMSPFDLYDIVEDDWKWQVYLLQPISSDLKNILAKLLQPAVRRRYQSAAEVLADLQALPPVSVDLVADPVANPVADLAIDRAADLVAERLLDWQKESIAINIPQSKAAFILPQTATPLVQETHWFADDIAAFKTLPLAWRVLIMSVGAAVGSAAMACLVLCLSIILFVLSTPLHANATFLKDNQTIFK